MSNESEILPSKWLEPNAVVPVNENTVRVLIKSVNDMDAYNRRITDEIESMRKSVQVAPDGWVRVEDGWVRVEDLFPVAEMKSREALIKAMVDNFLGWNLPKDFAPDAGISFKPNLTVYVTNHPSWPVGTNLLTADQAREMFEHCLPPN